MSYIQVEIKSGKVLEIEKKYDRRYFPKTKTTKFKKNSFRSEKVNKTTEAQEKINYRQKELKLTRLLNCNFESGDFHVVFSYEFDNKPKTIDDMKTDRRNLLKKLRREYKKISKEFKYICIAEVGQRGALHFHFVMNKIDTDIIQKCWDKGVVRISLLDNSGQYKQLAAYLLKYTRTNKEEAKKLNGKAWTASKNLKKPIITIKVITKNEYFKEEVSKSKKYNNYYLEKNSVYTGFNEFTGYKYFKYTLIEKERG